MNRPPEPDDRTPPDSAPARSGKARKSIGRYTLVRRVGQGGMGTVFEATDRNLARRVALKILGGSDREAAALQRFFREVKSAGRFNHPNIVHAYDAGFDVDTPYLVMEFVEGENLYQRFLRTGPFDVETTLDLLAQAGSAFGFLEKVRWTHGDGKPSNWIVTPDGHLKLVDLGLCRPPGARREGELVHGTPPYIAPEVMKRGGRIDLRADFYALGATFYQLLTGRPVLNAPSVKQLEKELRKGSRPTPLAELREDLPRPLIRFIEQLLAHDPDERPANVEEYAAALARVPGAPPVEDPDRVMESVDENPPARRFSPVVLAALGFVVVGIAVVVAAFGLGGDDTTENGIVDDGALPDAATESTELVTDDERAASLEAEVAFGLDARLAETPTDYRAILQAVAGVTNGAAAFRLREKIDAALEAEATPLWAEVSERATRAYDASAPATAIAVLEEFPSRLRAGRFEAGMKAFLEQWSEIVQARDAELEEQVRAAWESAGPIGVRGLTREFASFPMTERVHLIGVVERALGGRPDLDGFDAGHERADAVARDLRRTIFEDDRGLAPSGISMLSPVEGVLAAIYSAHPELRSMSESELAAHVATNEAWLDVPAEWAELIAAYRRGELRNRRTDARAEPSLVARERAAQKKAGRAMDAARAGRGDEARALWDALEQAPFDATGAGRALARDRAELERELARQEMILGLDVPGNVTSSWRGPAMLEIDLTKPESRAWVRARPADWKFGAEGWRPRDKELVVADSFVPFEGDVRVVLVAVPDEDAEVSFGIEYAEVAVGFRKTEDGLEVATGTSFEALANATGEKIPLLVRSGPLELVVDFTSTSVKVSVGPLSVEAERPQPIDLAGVVPAGGAPSIAVTRQARIERFSVRGRIPTEFLEALTGSAE